MVSHTTRCPKGHRLGPNEVNCTLCDLLGDHFKPTEERPRGANSTSSYRPHATKDILSQSDSSQSRYVEESKFLGEVSLQRQKDEDTNLSRYGRREASKGVHAREEGSRLQSSAEFLSGKWKESGAQSSSRQSNVDHDVGESIRSTNINEAANMELPIAPARKHAVSSASDGLGEWRKVDAHRLPTGTARADELYADENSKLPVESERKQALSEASGRLGEWRRVENYRHKSSTASSVDPGEMPAKRNGPDISTVISYPSGGDSRPQREKIRTSSAINKCEKGHIMLKNEDQCSWCKIREHSSFREVKQRSSKPSLLPSSGSSLSADQRTIDEDTPARYRTTSDSADRYGMVDERCGREMAPSALKFRQDRHVVDMETKNSDQQVEQTDKTTSRDRSSSTGLKSWIKSILK